jgi:glycosyltransferase involved in cell wall biosynthesis
MCVVIPAFNEEHTVGQVVTSVYRAVPDACVLVVDDGSTDKTSERAAAAGAAVVSLCVNLGIGGAVQTGYLYALRHQFDICIQIDGDGQHDPDELPRLVAPLLEGQADMVVGSRWLGRGNYQAPRSRRLGMKILAGLVHWRIPTPVTDPTSGFRAVGRQGINLFAGTYPTDFPEVESLLLAAAYGLRVREVPVVMRPRTFGRSSINGLRAGYYMARVAMAVLVNRASRREDS